MDTVEIGENWWKYVTIIRQNTKSDRPKKGTLKILGCKLVKPVISFRIGVI